MHGFSTAWLAPLTFALFKGQLYFEIFLDMSFSNANAVGLSLSSSICLFATSCTVACQAPLFIALPRQEYCSGVLFPFPGDLPPSNQTHISYIGSGFFTPEPPGKANANIRR